MDPRAAPPVRKLPNPPRPALAGLLTLAVMFTLKVAADLVLPLLVAALLSLLLSPLVGRLRRHGAPAPLAAVAAVALVIGTVGWGLSALSVPAADWLDRAPSIIGQLESKLRPVRKPVEEVRKATEQVQRLAQPDDGRTGTVRIRRVDLGDVFVVSLSKLAAQTAIVLFLIYFLLTSGDAVTRRLMASPATFEGRRRAVSVVRRIRHDVVVYLGLQTLINAGLGVATGLAMWALEMPNPALWGVMAAVLNYMPYAGPGIALAVLAMVGMLTFDGLGRGLLPAGVFFLFTNIEGNLITPTLVGRRLTLPPLVVFLSLVVWSWMWGIPGALLATPILLVIKVAADHMDSPAFLAPMLGSGRPRRRRFAGAREKP